MLAQEDDYSHMVGLGLVMWIFLVLFIVLSAAIGGATLCDTFTAPSSSCSAGPCAVWQSGCGCSTCTMPSHWFEGSLAWCRPLIQVCCARLVRLGVHDCLGRAAVHHQHQARVGGALCDARGPCAHAQAGAAASLPASCAFLASHVHFAASSIAASCLLSAAIIHNIACLLPHWCT